MAGVLYRNVLCPCRLDVPGSKCTTTPKVIENELVKILWDFQIQINKMAANQSDMMMVNKQNKKAIVVDVTIPCDSNIRKKEQEKLKEYQGLK